MKTILVFSLEAVLSALGAARAIVGRTLNGKHAPALSRRYDTEF